MATADPTIADLTHRLDQLAADHRALSDVVERQDRELSLLRGQAQDVAPPCRACGERVLGFHAPEAEVDRDALRKLSIDPESGHRIRCGAVATRRNREAREVRP